MATGVGKLEKLGRTIRAEFAEGDVIQTEILSTRENIRIGFDPRNQFAEDDAKAENITAFVVPFASQTFRRHPVGRADRWQSVTIPRNNAVTNTQTQSA